MSRLERLSHLSVIFLAVVALFVAMRELSAIAAPVLLALVTGIVLSPINDFWHRRGWSDTMGAFVSMAFVIVLIAALFYALYPVVLQLVEEAPKVWADMQDIIAGVQRTLAGFEEVSQQVTDAIAEEGEAAAPAAAPAGDGALPTVTEAIFFIPSAVAMFLVYIGTLFFFTLTRARIYQWVARHLAQPDDRLAMSLRLREAEGKVSSYFLAITAVNATLGVATAIALTLIGLPGATLWGVVVFAMNYILYLGPAAAATGLGFAGIAAFDGGYAALPAVTFVCLNAIEAQFVTPSVVGQHTSINPLVVFLALIFGIWLWGPVGGIVAIPTLIYVLVLNDVLREEVEDDTAQSKAEEALAG